MTTVTQKPAASQIDLDQPILTIPSHGIQIRMLEHSDASLMAKHGNNRKIAQNMRARWPEPYTEDSGHDFIARSRNKNNWFSTTTGLSRSNSRLADSEGQMLPFVWAITIDDEIIGTIGYEFHSDVEARTAEFGYWICEDYWGKGVATAVLRVFVPWFWSTYPYIVRLTAMVYAWNVASSRVLEKNGFEFEGRMRASVERYGRLTDTLVYACVRDGVEVTATAPSEENLS